MIGHEAILGRSAHEEDRKSRRKNGMSESGVARLFGISLSSVKRYSRIASRGGSLQPRKGGGRPPKTDQTTEKLLGEDVEERPAATIVERRRFLERVTGEALSDSAVGRLLKRMGFSPKNGPWGRWNETSG
jgi:transposase